MAITTEMRAVITSALEMKEASIKRAKNSNKSPNFAPVYDLELAQTRDAITWLNTQELAKQK